jgi:hypothetical protein
MGCVASSALSLASAAASTRSQWSADSSGSAGVNWYSASGSRRPHAPQTLSSLTVLACAKACTHAALSSSVTCMCLSIVSRMLRQTLV